MSDPIKVLVIDDSEDDRMLLRRTLQKMPAPGYIVSEADDGDKGFRSIQAEEPACILLDYSMPGRNGVEMLKRIRGEHPFIPVVMMTGQGNENVAVTAMQEGAQNYISKSSLSAEALEQMIRLAIEHCALQKRIHEQRTSLEVFTRALAHDLKEPVRTIRSFAELIAERETFSEKTKAQFQHIQKAAGRMQMLIETVYLYTRLEDPGQTVRVICDTGTILNEVKENVSKLIAERGATVASDHLPEVYANRIQLIQLFQNLLCNAIHHSDNAVAVRFGAEKKADHWLFRVSDNGPGIEEAQFQKIFEPFKRLSRGSEQGGAGLGLAICKKIIEQHHGRIWCESKPGAGATFFFTLPDAVPPAKEKDSPAKKSTPATVAVHPRTGASLANVLLVDDSPADIEITRFRLIDNPRLKCNLLVAGDGKAALFALQNSVKNNAPIDLLLLDINMPDMDGFEVLERIRKEKELQHIAVVMCTGSTYDKDVARARALGAAGYITKPVEFQQLSVISETPTVQLYQNGDGFEYSLLRVA